MTCPRCQSEIVNEELTPDKQHYAKESCGVCGCWLRWLPKPDREKIRRPSAHRNLVKKFSHGYCELCCTAEQDLPPGQVLEAQHGVEFQDGGEPTRENIWILCTACHKLVHCIRHHYRPQGLHVSN